MGSAFPASGYNEVEIEIEIGMPIKGIYKNALERT